jgi:hypothetical protein
MRTQWHVLMLVAAIGCASPGAWAAVNAPALGHEAAPPVVTKPQGAESRPSSPEDEALKRLVGQRKSNKGIALSSGPPTRPHKVLGPVKVEAPAPKDGVNTKAGPNLYLNELLRNKAVETYGEDKVDGVASITYEPAAGGKVRASGTAVQFEKKD